MASTEDGQSIADEHRKLDSARSQPSDGRAWERKVSRALSEAQKKNERIRITVSLVGIVITLIIILVVGTML